ncbi:MAG: NAD(P)H-dependent oxidoreductase, partial [Planctomycetota bacterium]
MRITLIDGHPRTESLCHGLADAYARGAEAAGHELRRITVRELDFNPVLRGAYDNRDPLEPALVQAQEDITWCEHLVVVHPVWWGQTPALLKGFF